MVDILIRAKREKVEHKLENNLKKEYGNDLTDVYCYWTGINPLKTKRGDRVMFTDGTNVYAEGIIIGVTYDEGLRFEPLKKVDYPQPKKAPTRGFTYLN